jgi:DHA2 family multidrug resistance protein
MVVSFVHEPDDIREANRAAAQDQRKNIDYAGIALMSVGLATLIYVLEEGQRLDWFQSKEITICSIIAVLALAAFVARELTAKIPVVNLRLFKDSVYLSGTLIGALMFAMLMANMFLLPVFMQELLGFTATQSGIALMPRVLVMMVVTPIVGRLYNVVSPRITVGFGVIMFTLGAYMQSHYTLATTQWGIVHALLVQGVGFACLFVPLTTAALSRIPRHQLTDATGLNSLFRQVGGSFGLAGFATVLTRSISTAKAGLLAHLDPTRQVVQDRLSAMANGLAARGGLDHASAQGAALGALSGQISLQSSVLGFERVFLLAGILFLCVLPILLFLKVDRSAERAEVHVEM